MTEPGAPNVPDDTPTLVHRREDGGAHPQPGDVIRGRFRLERVLGEGGMGRVFLATDLNRESYRDSEPHVAIKFLGEQFAQHPQSRHALQRETRNAQRLSHPNIVRVFDFDQDGAHVFMTMEYMRGTPLDRFIRSVGPSGLPFERIWPIVQGMGAGLSHIHRMGLVHADFKPGNVFVEEDGTAKILDLGIARVIDAATRTQGITRFDPAALRALTPEYASCEMFDGVAPDPRDDVYALACVTYQLLTGRHPWDGTWSIHARQEKLTLKPVESLPKRRWRALARGLALVRSERSASVDVFLRELEAKRERSVAKALFAAVAGAAAVTGAVLWLQNDPDRAFVRERLAAAPAHVPSAREAEQVERWIAQGADLLRFGAASVASGDVVAGHLDLSGGTSNAWSAYESVLAVTRDEAAAEGMLAIARAYADGAAARAKAGERATALWLACEAQRLHPAQRASKALVAALASPSDGNVDPAAACAAALAGGPPDE